MSDLFHFRHNSLPRRISDLVIFCAQNTVDAADLFETLDADVIENLRPDRIFILVRFDALELCSTKIRSWISDKGRWRFDPESVPLCLLSFDALGRLHTSCPITGDAPDSPTEMFQDLMAAGLKHIFVARDGLLLPGKAVHYVHPSGRHSRGFVRTANVLIKGPETMFIAASLLRHLEQIPRTIWVDTSSICSIPYAMSLLRQSMEKYFIPPSVSSFSSYDGLQSTRFQEAENCLALISATTSGGLARRMTALGFRSDRIINLFSLAKNKQGLSVHCDLSMDRDINPDGSYSATDDFEAADCLMCREGSKPVRFVGDQFLTDAIIYEPYTILATDLPKNLSEIMSSYAKLNVFKVKARPGDRAANNVWIDVKELCKNEQFIERFKELCDRYATASTALLVHSDEPGARDLAEIISAHLGVRLKKLPSVCAIHELNQLEEKDAFGSVIVIANCIDSGSTMQTASLNLRNLFRDRPRLYVAAFAKHSHLKSYSMLENDLKFNSGRPRHEIAILHSLTLPIIPKMSSWDIEQQILDEFSVSASQLKDGEQIEALVEGRLRLLRNLAEGAHDDLFWRSPVNNTLRLRQTFAFWPSFEYEHDTICQASVFSTVACVVENLRHGAGAKLRHSEFYHGLLAPAVFGRFSDGIIQASFLRCSTPQELNYAAHQSSSEDMARLLEHVLDAWDTSKGEAAIEFIVSIMSKRLTLLPHHLHNVLRRRDGAPALLNAMIDRCRQLI